MGEKETEASQPSAFKLCPLFYAPHFSVNEIQATVPKMAAKTKKNGRGYQREVMMALFAGQKNFLLASNTFNSTY